MVLFVVVVLLAWSSAFGAWWFWERGRKASDLERIKRRMTGLTEAPARGRSAPTLIRGQEVTAGKLVLAILQRLRLNERLKNLIEQAGLKWSVARTMHAMLGLALGGFSVVWYLAPVFRIAAPLVGLVAGVIPLLYVIRCRGSRLRKFEEQFPESLEFLARSMRAGHAFSVSLELIHTEFQDPLAGEFRRAFDEQNLGLPLDVALQNLAVRVPSMDVHFFVSAVTLQKRTGGNLAELLDKLAYLIRERFKLRGRIRAISAHGRMTGATLSAIPVGVGVLMCYVNRDYATFFTTDDTGQMLLGGAITLQLLGYAVIKKIISIEV